MPSPKKPAKNAAAKKAPSTKKVAKPAAKASKAVKLDTPAPAPVPKYKPVPGSKVFLRGRASAGFGEIVSVSGAKAKVRFFRDVVNTTEVEVPIEIIAHGPLPNQTRVFHQQDGVSRYGRVMVTKDGSSALRTYLVHFPGAATLAEMKESDFAVRSYLPGDDPSVVLAELAQETPFFFQQRSDLLRELLKQNQLAHGLPALLSAKVEVLQHQAEVADRVLRDPTIRYLLADEVGLGKTIEAGIILRQKTTPRVST